MCLKLIGNLTRVDLLNRNVLFFHIKNSGGRWLLMLIQGFSGVRAEAQLFSGPFVVVSQWLLQF